MKTSRSYIAILSTVTMALLTGCGSGLRSGLSSPGDLETGQITSVQPNPIPQSSSPVLVQIQGGPFTPTTTLNFRDASGNLLIENQPLSSSSPTTASVFASFENFPTVASVEIAGSTAKQPAFPIALGGGNVQPPTDYPYLNAAPPNATPPSGILVADMWGFDIGESTSYVAWKVNQSLGLTSFTTNKDGSFHFDTTQPHAFWNHADSTSTVTETWGDASNWQQHAEDLNRIDPTIYWDHNATVHCIYVDPSGDHVAWVEAVSTSTTGTTTANLSEFDYSPPYGHQFSTRTITVSSADVFIHVLGSTPQSGFTIAVDPNDMKQTITQGQSATFHTTVTSVGGFSAPVAWYAIGLPAGYASGTGWNPQVVTPAPNGQASAVFTLAANSLTATGTRMMTLKAISSNVNAVQELPVSITVNAAKPVADYSIATPSTAVTVKAGQAVGIELTAIGTGGFAGTITPSALGVSNFAASNSMWSPSTIVLNTNGTGSSTYYLYANSTATPGTYPVTLHTTSGNLTHDLTVNVTVTPNPADYSITTPSTAVSVKAGEVVGIPLTATGTGGFSGTITLEALGWTSFGTTASKWSPTAIVLPGNSSNSTGSATLYLYTSSTATPGTYPVTLHTTSGSLTHDTIVNVTVTPNPADYSIATHSTAYTVIAGQSVGITLTAASIGGFTGTITPQALGLSGFAATSSKWSPTTIVLSSTATGSSASSTFNLYANSNATPGTYPVTLHTTSGNLTHDLIVNVTVTPNPADYTIATPSAAVTVKAGQAVGIPLTATGSGGFSGTITLEAQGWTGFGTTASKWSPTAIVLTTNASGSATFYLYTNATATPGTYPVTLHTTSGSLTHDTTVSVTVTPNPADYSIAAPSTAVTVKAGQDVGIKLTATGTGGFSGTITLEALGWTSFGTSASYWSPTAIVVPASTTNSTGSATFYLFTSPTATPGTYPVTLHTTSGTLTHDITVSVTVTPNPADYSIATQSTSYTVKAGQAVGITLTAASIGGFSGTITPSALGLSSFAATTSKWSPSTIVLSSAATGSTASSTLYLYTNSTATPGIYPLTLHTASGTLSHDLTVSVTVTANPADYSIATPSTAVSVKAGEAVGIQLTATGSGGFAGTIALEALGWTSFGTTASKWSPTAIVLLSPTSNSSGSATFYLYTSSTATPGTYPVTLHTTSGNLTHDLIVNVTVTANPPIITSVTVGIAGSSTSIEPLTIIGTGFSTQTGGGYAIFIDPNGITYSSKDYPTRVLSSSTTQWVFNMQDINQSPNPNGTWSVQMFNASGQGSNVIQFQVK